MVITTPATGDVSFAGIPIYVIVDSTLAITETDETNNVLSSIGSASLRINRVLLLLAWFSSGREQHLPELR